MTCPDFDWKGFVLEELPAAEKRQARHHLDGCASCRQEVEELELTLTALSRLPVAEIPRRIGFVSDPVFEDPWWKRLWNTGPRLGFAAAAMLACAIVAHGYMLKPVPGSKLSEQEIEARVQARLETEVARRVSAEVSARLQDNIQPVRADLTARLEDYEKRQSAQRREDLKALDSYLVHMDKKMSTALLSAARFGGD